MSTNLFDNALSKLNSLTNRFYLGKFGELTYHAEHLLGTHLKNEKSNTEELQQATIDFKNNFVNTLYLRSNSDKINQGQYDAMGKALAKVVELAEKSGNKNFIDSAKIVSTCFSNHEKDFEKDINSASKQFSLAR